MISIAFRRVLKSAFFALTILLSTFSAADHAVQPPDSDSSLAVNGGAAITDDAFITLMQSLLEDGNDGSNVRNATFLFQQCFGGGFIDELEGDLDVDFQAGAAARWDQCSVGPITAAEVAAWLADPNVPQAKKDQWNMVPQAVKDFWVKDGADFWTDTIVNEFNRPSIPTIIQAINRAKNNDPAKNFETPEGHAEIDPNGPGNPPLKDPNAQSYHAIIYAGQPDKKRHFNDVMKIYDLLEAKWGAPNGTSITIDVLFGNGATNSEGTALPNKWGAMSATAANLTAKVNALKPKINPNEQFLWYSTGHGGNSNTQAKQPLPISVGGNEVVSIPIEEGMYEGIEFDYDNQPFLTFDYAFQQPLGPAQLLDVFWGDPNNGGILIGSVSENDPQNGDFFIPIDESIILPGITDIVFINATQSDVDIFNVTFDTGDVNADPFDFQTGGASFDIPLSPWAVSLVAVVLGVVAWRFKI